MRSVHMSARRRDLRHRCFPVQVASSRRRHRKEHSAMIDYVLIQGAWHGSWCWARVRRLLAAGAHRVFTPTGEYRFDGWRLDRRSRRLTDPQERPVALSKSEYALLLAFLDAPERPLSREYLLQATRLHEDIFDRSIDVQVLRLRRKLQADPKAPHVIKTERGVGYVFAIPVEQSRRADWRSVPQSR